MCGDFEQGALKNVKNNIFSILLSVSSSSFPIWSDSPDWFLDESGGNVTRLHWQLLQIEGPVYTICYTVRMVLNT